MEALLEWKNKRSLGHAGGGRTMGRDKSIKEETEDRVGERILESFLPSLDSQSLC